MATATKMWVQDNASKIRIFLQNTMVIYKESLQIERDLVSCLQHWERKLNIFYKQYEILNKILELGEDIIMKEYLLGGDNIGNLQSYIYILELKVEILQQRRKKMMETHPPLLGSIGRYQKFLENFLGIFGLGILSSGHLEEDNVLNQWDSYAVHHFAPTVEFSEELMDRYTYLVSQCQ